MTIVSGLMLISFTSVYFMYADTRQGEFYQRLQDKCKTTYRFLIEMEEKDHNLLQAIDRNTINELYDEKVLIFDDHNKIIYSSIDDKKINYSQALLERIRKKEEVRIKEGDNEVYGVLIHEPDKDYVVLASSFDIYGHRKLELITPIHGNFARITIHRGYFLRMDFKD